MTQPASAPQDERDEGAPTNAIPGAWARPASAFADESSVVRPADRASEGGSRAVSLVVLAVLALGTAGFAWGVTVALQQLDADEPGVGVPARATTAERPASSGESATPASAAVTPPVPDADPSFPALPDAQAADPSVDARAAAEPSVDEPDIDIPTPKLLRLARAEGGDDEDPKKKRYKRLARKKQQLARKGRAKRAKDARQGTEPTAPAAVSSSEPPAPTAASLTRDAEQLFSQGKLVEARAVAERALDLSRGYPRAHRALAVICAKQGDTTCARQGYETYLRLAPNAPDAPDVRRILGM